jgi:hypothetical protein
MKSPDSLRKETNLSQPLQRRLNMYAVAAGAVGVGTLAFTPLAHGKIVYTPAHVRLHGIVPLDLNHDGKADFAFSTFKTCAKKGVCSAHVAAGAYNSLGGVEYGNRGAAALFAGAKIGSKDKFVRNAYMLQVATMGGVSNVSGSWYNATRRYLGLKFTIHGKTHFGWARLNVHHNGLLITATLTGYAYETIPGKTIIAGRTAGTEEVPPLPASLNLGENAGRGRPPTLAVLAIGAPGLSIWRREALSTATPEAN